MGFKWNGVHTNELGILAEARTLPVLPEPAVVIEELPGRDGFYDFSAVNMDRRVHYRPREWDYRCSLETKDFNGRIGAVTRMLVDTSGWLVDDKCPGVRWYGVIVNRVNIMRAALYLNNFDVFIRTQSFAEGFEIVTETITISSDGPVSIANPGTWHSRSDVCLTGTTAAGAYIGDMPVLMTGVLDNACIMGPELAPGDNDIAVTGFTGTLRIEFTPRYIWNSA